MRGSFEIVTACSTYEDFNITLEGFQGLGLWHHLSRMKLSYTLPHLRSLKFTILRLMICILFI